MWPRCSKTGYPPCSVVSTTRVYSAGASARPYGTADALAADQLDGLRDLLREASRSGAERDRRMRRRLRDAHDPGRLEAVEDRGVLRQGDPADRLVQVVQIRVDRAALEVDQLVARDREVGAQLDERQHPALPGLDAVAGGRRRAA